MALNPKQQRFVQEYLVDGNGTRSAIAAGYSKRTAYAQASRLLNHAEIRASLDRSRTKAASKFDITAERVLSEYARLGFGDIRKIVRWQSQVVSQVENVDTGEMQMVHANDVALTNSEDLDDDAAAMISEISVDKDGRLKVKLHSKTAALDSLAKHLGLFQADNEQLAGGLAGRLEAARRRARKPE